LIFGTTKYSKDTKKGSDRRARLYSRVTFNAPVSRSLRGSCARTMRLMFVPIKKVAGVLCSHEELVLNRFKARKPLLSKRNEAFMDSHVGRAHDDGR